MFRWRKLGVAALVAVGVTATPTTPLAAAEPGPPPYAGPGHNEMCDSLAWPRQMPDVVGLIFDGKYEFGQLARLLGARVVDSDGKTVYENGRNTGVFGPHRIIAVSPPPGTPIGRHDQVTVTVVKEDYNAAPPSGLRPCDWISTEEASALLGGPPVTTQASGDHKGSTDIVCGYTTKDGSRGVDAFLTLSGAYVVDAATNFNFHMAHGNASVTSIDGLGIQAACALTYHPSGQRNHLWIVLPGERLLIVSDSGDPRRAPGASCDTLTEFARIAIPRIG